MRGPAADRIAAGALIERLRGQAGLSQTQLAARAGLHWATVHRLERGLAYPELPTVGAVLRALGVGARIQGEVLRRLAGLGPDGSLR